MTGDHFEEGLEINYSLLINSLIIMDNASYHTRRCEEVPVKSWTKKRMIEWMDNKGIAHPPKALKSEIFSIIAGLNLTPRYVVDEMAEAAGHEVVRLPVALNLTEVERLAWEGFEVVTPECWASLIKHVKEKVEDHYWEGDGLAESYSVREFTFRIRWRPDDDPNEESSDITSDSDSNDPVADEDF